MQVPQKLTTSKLVLEPIDVSHAKLINEALIESHNDLSKWLDWCTKIPTLNQTISFCEYSKQQSEKKLHMVMSIFLKQGTYIGNISLTRNSIDDNFFELGYWLRSSQVGNGYMLEAVNSLLKFTSIHMKTYEILLTTDSTNIKSQAVAENAGFKLKRIIDNDIYGKNKIKRNTKLYTYG